MSKVLGTALAVPWTALLALALRHLRRRYSPAGKAIETGELRTRWHEKEYGIRKQFVVKQHACEVVLQCFPKLECGKRQDEPGPDIGPTNNPT